MLVLDPVLKPKERPILFQGAMVRAIRSGAKTQTRRLVADGLADLPADTRASVLRIDGEQRAYASFSWPIDKATSGGTGAYCPYGQPGDRLWVREAWRADVMFDGRAPRDIPQGAVIEYEATSAADVPWPASMGKLRPSMFMPRWASRILLEVTEVRVERLQSISEADAIAEGCDSPQAMGFNFARLEYRDLWDSINGAPVIERDDDGREIGRHFVNWEANPYVWAVSFRRVTP